MRIELDTKANTLYLQLVDEIRDGEAVHTIQLEEEVYVDLDKDHRTLGIEFLDADDFQDFLRRNGGELEVTAGTIIGGGENRSEVVLTAEDEQEVPITYREAIAERIASEEGREPTRRRRGRG